MKVFAVILILAVGAKASVNASYGECYKETVESCSAGKSKRTQNIENCNAVYGAISELSSPLQSYASAHVYRNYEFLLMATHFGNYETNRLGFKKVFRELADDSWKKAIDLIKYITKRGGKMDFNVPDNIPKEDGKGTYELYEMESLAKALDIEKQMATRAHEIHREATRNREKYHDPEISSYLEEHFVHKHADTIRKLSGHISDLRSFYKSEDSSLALHLFDDYLLEH